MINSVGAYYRVRARYLGGETIERVHKSPLDGLFLSQIDLVLQYVINHDLFRDHKVNLPPFRHARLISARFSYTPSNCTLFALTPLLQYTIPDNLGLFVASLSESQLRNDPRLAGFNPQQARLQAAIAAMVQLMEDEPKWFEKSHYRVRLQPSAPKPPARSLDSGIGESVTTASSAVVPITQPLALHCAQPDNLVKTSSPTGVVVATSPLEEDVRPLLGEEAEEVSIIFFSFHFNYLVLDRFHGTKGDCCNHQIRTVCRWVRKNNRATTSQPIRRSTVRLSSTKYHQNARYH